MTDRIDRQWQRAQRYLAERQFGPARAALESLLLRDPTHLQAHLAIGRIAWAEGSLRDAVRHALDAVRNTPRETDPTVVVDVVATLLQVGEVVAARDCLNHPALASLRDGQTLVRLALLRQMVNEHAEALSLLDRAAAAGVDTPDFHFYRGVESTFNGRMQDAEREFEACLRQAPMFGRAALALSRLRKQTPESNHLDDLAARLRAISGMAQGWEDHAALEFARYKELEDLGRYEEAWEALVRANAIMFAQLRYDAEYERRLFDRLIDLCTSDFLKPVEVQHEGPQPIFILGMMRSGTTLLDRILSNHSRVTSAGELDDFGMQLRWAADHRFTLDDHMLQRLPGLDYVEIGRRYLAQTQWRAQGRSFFIDKLPRNWMVAGLIRRALPQARILHLAREPMDVCFSNFRTQFSDRFPYTYNLDALAAHYRQYRRVMAHWHAAMPGQLMAVPYADLVREPEATARKVLDFCGLEWEPGCVDLTRNKSAVATLSMVQVREPIHARSFGEWRHYERQLEGLRKALEA